MGFGSFIGGIVLCILAVLIGFFGIAVLLGFANFIAASVAVPLGIGIIILALVLFLFGWYSYKSAKPQGTIDVHTQ
jgi:protein-S-isoprenylcysteine O-methyltransferase Ste14